MDAHDVAADKINRKYGKNSSISKFESYFPRGFGNPFFFMILWRTRWRMLNDSFPRMHIYASELVVTPRTRSSFIDAHDSLSRAVNKIADLSTSMCRATAKRNYTECVLTVRVIYVLTINDRDLSRGSNGSRCVKNIPMRRIRVHAIG